MARVSLTGAILAHAHRLLLSHVKVVRCPVTCLTLQLRTVCPNDDLAFLVAALYDTDIAGFQL